MQHTPGLDHPRSRTALRSVQRLVSGYFGLSVLTLVAIVLLRGDAAAVNDAVWIRGTLVVVSAVVMFVCAVRAARGSRPAYRRMRIISTVMVLVIAVIIALPGTFPLWMKIEQGVCGLFLTGVVAILNGRHLRTLFADR
ncbi:hypothetical protein [Streptomyces natalensis]|uniref:Membrane protein n=1 Tax=Streptomyces natalensis ATCC 27448 TaxID=1240678 RepID=A0A0D7CCA5_9ACTN|nr:hypothetical protein [Streptomyces natalensis]KIZ13671.1 membrane protein [Streptomyces natalensis ATCC 27448]